MACLVITMGTFAQTPEKKEESKMLRKDIKAKKAENHEMVKDATKLKIHEAKEEHKEAVADKKAIHRHADNLKDMGVHHPVQRAKHQIHAEKEAKKYKD